MTLSTVAGCTSPEPSAPARSSSSAASPRTRPATSRGSPRRTSLRRLAARARGGPDDFIFSGYKERLEALGSGINEVLQVEQYIPHKVYADGYIDTSRGQGLHGPRPAFQRSACDRRPAPETCVINPTGGCADPRRGSHEGDPERDQRLPREPPARRVRRHLRERRTVQRDRNRGGYVFTVGDIANDWEDQADPRGGSRERQHLVGERDPQRDRVPAGRLKRLAGEASDGPRQRRPPQRLPDRHADLSSSTAHGKVFADDRRPARDPASRAGPPRLEAEGLGHKDNAVKSEFIAASIRPGFGLERESSARD